ncbi:MAG: sensor domain-containing diguanylate cyclase [Alphaproteobacteria bacterium]|nr:sensor domain-containing diguanylate cyclase [Alphaproteobacteria bacterium]
MNQQHSAAEMARLEALYGYDILDSDPEPRFDRIVRLASRLLQMPISLVSLVDEARQWFKARVGLSVAETPRDIAFCSHAIEQDQVMVVEDAARDPRFRANPLVTDNPNIRFYAGAPLATNDGHKIGTLCVIDRVPRQLTEEQRGLLEDLAALVVDEIELRRLNAQLTQLATTDPMTGLWNRRRFFALAEIERERSRRYSRGFSLLMLDIDRFKSINDRFGHDVGDRAIEHIARICEAQKRPHDIAARIGGEEFVILMPETGMSGAVAFAERLRRAIANNGFASGGDTINPTVSIGVSEGDATTAISELLKTADLALYDAKEGGRNRVCQRINGERKSG